jgi:hypothetical protein
VIEVADIDTEATRCRGREAPSGGADRGSKPACLENKTGRLKGNCRVMTTPRTRGPISPAGCCERERAKLMILRATIDIFSGRPNLSWIIRGDQCASILREIALHRAVIGIPPTSKQCWVIDA